MLTVISVIALVYVGSDFGKIVEGRLFPQVIPVTFWFYLTLFFGIIYLVNVYDVSKLTTSNWKVLVVSFASTFLDTFLICSVELVCLLAIGVFVQDYIQLISILLLGALPASLGSIILTSLTARAMKERSKRLLEETIAMRKENDRAMERRRNVVKQSEERQEETDKLIEEIES
jgi:hypothetical protein